MDDKRIKKGEYMPGNKKKNSFNKTPYFKFLQRKKRKKEKPINDFPSTIILSFWKDPKTLGDVINIQSGKLGNVK